MAEATLTLNAPTCPECKTAIHPVSGAMLIQGSVGTYTSHCHVVCPCGWYDFTETVEQASEMAQRHAVACVGAGGSGEAT